MKKVEKKVYVLLFSLIIVASISILLSRVDEHILETGSVEINSHIFSVEIADSYSERIQGLSGREVLAQDAAMLFIFPYEDEQGIWMKEMKLSLDILWVDSYRRIVHIEENVSPETFPKVYKPEKKARFVIELPAGSVSQFKIQLGQKINFK